MKEAAEKANVAATTIREIVFMFRLPRTGFVLSSMRATSENAIKLRFILVCLRRAEGGATIPDQIPTTGALHNQLRTALIILHLRFDESIGGFLARVTTAMIAQLNRESV